MEASERPKQAQRLFTSKKQNANTRVQGLSDSRGMVVDDRAVIRLSSNPHPPKLKKVRRFCHNSQMFQFTSLRFGLATASQVFTMIVKEVNLMALLTCSETISAHRAKPCKLDLHPKDHSIQFFTDAANEG